MASIWPVKLDGSFGYRTVSDRLAALMLVMTAALRHRALLYSMLRWSRKPHRGGTSLVVPIPG